jgi:hypothetical protein
MNCAHFRAAFADASTVIFDTFWKSARPCVKSAQVAAWLCCRFDVARG